MTIPPSAERELLLRYRPWLRTVARGMCRAMPQWAEDCAAEGWVAMWRSIASYPGDAPSDAWLKASALNRMRQCVRDWTAQCRDARLTDLAGAPGMRTTEDRDRTLDVWDGLSVDLGTIELAYHHGEIRAALDALPPKQRLYVFLKYWGGYTDTEMVPHFGYRPKTLGEHARTKLAAQLAHLR